MKSVMKQMLIAAVALLAVAPAFAADNVDAPRAPTKGTKSYQVSREASAPEEITAINDKAVQDIAPAAGATEEKADEGKTLREEIRLPRKN